MISVTVKFFAVTKDVVGKADEVFSLKEGATVASLLDEIVRVYPKLLDWKPYLRVAVNQEYALPSTPLNESDEVAIIPPVSGG